jgi:DNA-binding transcriptional LysR family regulator
MDLNALAVFRAVAETGGFRTAADRLGVTRSAVSQTMRRLEESLGVALVRRTTRSVSLTEEGARLFQAIAPALAEIAAAVDTAADRPGRPRGLLRLAVSSIAESFLSGPLLAGFAEAHPEVALDILVTDEEFDIVAAGYDAGVRLGEVIEADMIAVPVSGDQREMAACAPSYLTRVGAPQHPRDLVQHRCIGWRPRPDLPPYRWEFTENGRDFEVAVKPEVTTNDLRLMIRLACAGAGITLAPADCLRPYVERGELAPVLENYCPPYPGFHLYYPNRHHLAPKLRALIDHVRAHRRPRAS